MLLKHCKAVIMQGHKDDGMYRSLLFYDNFAVLDDLTANTRYVISYKPEKVNWDIVAEAGGMVIDEVVLGFSLDDYFGDDYNVCKKVNDAVGKK